MYKQYLEVRDTKNGKGLFSTVKIPSDTPVMEIFGTILLDREIKDNLDEHLQIGPNTFLSPSGDITDSLNHHCEPNCKLHIVGNRAIIYSLYVIPADAEITVDYSTSSTDTKEDWQMECKCSSYKCRKIISGHHYLNEELKEKYKEMGMFPLYILEPKLITKR